MSSVMDYRTSAPDVRYIFLSLICYGAAMPRTSLLRPFCALFA